MTSLPPEAELPCGTVSVDDALADVRFPAGSTTGNCNGNCCKKSVLLDSRERLTIERAAALIIPFLDPEQPTESSRWFDHRRFKDRDFPSGEAYSTAAGPFGCVFLNRRGRCVLQITERSLPSCATPLKPFYCRLYPLTVERGRLLFDERAGLKCKGCCIPEPLGPRTVSQVCKEELMLAGLLTPTDPPLRGPG
jgi:hypothetical protein